MKKLLILSTTLLLTSCTAPDRSKKALQDAGYTDIELEGYAFFECGEGDNFHTGFTAKNAQGRQVQGTVCCGLTKGCTVRH